MSMICPKCKGELDKVKELTNHFRCMHDNLVWKLEEEGSRIYLRIVDPPSDYVGDVRYPAVDL